MWWLSRQTNSAGDWNVRILRDGVQALATKFNDLQPLMEMIGRYLRSASQIAFLNQSFDGKKWPARSGSPGHPSILGAVADLEKGPEIKDSRFTDRPALVDTGALRRSITYIAGKKTVRLTSHLPYAQLMNDGGPASLPVTVTVKNNLKALLKAEPGLRSSLGFLFGREEVHAEIPERKFLGVAESSRDKIKEMMQDYLEHEAQS